MGIRTMKHSLFFKTQFMKNGKKKVSTNPLFMGKTHIFFELCFKMKICNQNQ